MHFQLKHHWVKCINTTKNRNKITGKHLHRKSFASIYHSSFSQSCAAGHIVAQIKWCVMKNRKTLFCFCFGNEDNTLRNSTRRYRPLTLTTRNLALPCEQKLVKRHTQQKPSSSPLLMLQSSCGKRHSFSDLDPYSDTLLFPVFPTSCL